MSMAETRTPLQRRIVTWIPYFWLLVFFLAPFLIVLKISLSETAIAMPPYRPVFDGLAGLWAKLAELSGANYEWIAGDPLYWHSYLSSLWIAAVSTLVTLLVGYPIAYGMARAPAAWRPALVMFVILPFWTSFLIRVYAWIGILKPEGLLNQFLLWTGLIDQPLFIMNTNTAVFIGIVYCYLPFMVLPLYATLSRLDPVLLEAAEDLGARPWRAFLAVTLPLSLPGILAGLMLVFIPAVGEFVIPELLGGPDAQLIGRVLWAEFFQNRDWPLASALAIALLVLLVVPIALFQKRLART